MKAIGYFYASGVVVLIVLSGVVLESSTTQALANKRMGEHRLYR